MARCVRLSRRIAFASWRSVPIRRPRPAWYQATATWTSPWKKSRSSVGAARQACSSSSCAAKYSPRGSARAPALNADSNFSVFDLDVVGAELDREVELVLARAHVVLPAVPRAGEDAALEAALAERALEVEAVLLDGVEAAVAVREGDLLVAGLDRRMVPGGTSSTRATGTNSTRATLATAPRAAVRSRRGDDPAVWGRCLLSGQARSPAAWPSLRDDRTAPTGPTS